MKKVCSQFKTSEYNKNGNFRFLALINLILFISDVSKFPETLLLGTRFNDLRDMFEPRRLLFSLNQYTREFGWTTSARFSYFSLLIKSDPWSLFSTYWLIDCLRLKISCRQIKVTSSSVISDPLLRRSARRILYYLWYSQGVFS